VTERFTVAHFAVFGSASATQQVFSRPRQSPYFQINEVVQLLVAIRLLIICVDSMRTLVTMLLLCGAVAFSQELPDAPSSSVTNQTRTLDRAFWFTTGVYGASVAGDAITTWAGRTSTCPHQGAAVGLHGTSPSSPRAALTMAGEFAIASVASYEFKKHNLHIGKLRLWELPFVARTYTHSHDTINNIVGCR
jgi:hypothetical protein